MVRVVGRADGGVSVITPAPGYNDASAFAQAMQAPELVGRPFVDQVSPPNPDGLGRRFRDAWRWSAGTVVHDIPKTRELRYAELVREGAALKASAHGRSGWRAYHTGIDGSLESSYFRLPSKNTVADIVALDPLFPSPLVGWF